MRHPTAGPIRWLCRLYSAQAQTTPNWKRMKMRISQKTILTFNPPAL